MTAVGKGSFGGAWDGNYEAGAGQPRYGAARCDSAIIRACLYEDDTEAYIGETLGSMSTKLFWKLLL
jgi:hypothetical protein